jgi:hypothetical protein
MLILRAAISRKQNYLTLLLIIFQDYESQDKFTIPCERVSHMLPEFCQDMIVRVYSKKPQLVSEIKYYPSFNIVFYKFTDPVHLTII